MVKTALYFVDVNVKLFVDVRVKLFLEIDHKVAVLKISEHLDADESLVVC